MSGNDTNYIVVYRGLLTRHERRRVDHQTTLESEVTMSESPYRLRCGCGGMVDAADLKSVVRMDVGVQVPPPAPFFTYIFICLELKIALKGNYFL